MNWIQVNNDGFLGYSSSLLNLIRPSLFVVGDLLCARTEHGVFAMVGSPEQKNWVAVPLPNTISDHEDYHCIPLAWDRTYLYVFLQGGLYFIERNGLPAGDGWQQVASAIPSPDDSLRCYGPIPKCVFKGRVYGFYHAYDPIEQMSLGFRVCRSADLGKAQMNWEVVAPPSFEQPKNVDVAFISGGVIRVNNWSPGIERIFVGTNTLQGFFGDEKSYTSDGVEVWESPTGDLGSWTRINTPGFGTRTTIPGKAFFTNQTIQSSTMATTWDRDYFYVGTATHFSPGAQVWRYDGTGVSGWQDVTPPWAPETAYNGVVDFTRRMTGLVGLDSLYLAEGFPTGNIGAYDGSTWKCIVPGRNPFGPQNQGLSSLEACTRWRYNLYAMTLPAPEVPEGEKKVQVWATSCAVPG